ncbi:MAG: serine hydrolase [Caldilineaceae bacterium]|nr:serine hydrolase [Caldilineaceae bacterium]
MKTYVLLVGLIVALLVSGCIAPIQPLPAQPAPVATADTTDAEAAAPSDAELAAYTETVKASLIAHLWRWTTYRSDAENVTVDTPTDYTLTFLEDGTLEIKADCNNAAATYVVDGFTGGIEIGPATLAACVSDSRSDQFLQLLGKATQFIASDTQLIIILDADTSVMVLDTDITTAVTFCGDDALTINTVEDTLAPELSATLDQGLVSLVQSPPRPGPGAVMMIETAQGRYFKSIGVADVETCEPLAADSPYQIGSNTKMMTSAMLFQLQEEGVLSTTDLLSQWLPDLAAQLPYGDQITVDMLLTHTSGLYDYFDVSDTDGATIADGETDKAMLTRAFTPQELVTLVADSGLSYFEPAAEGKWQYSNTGYILLGLIIEKATGITYEENLKTRIFEPLGLEKTYLQTGAPEPGSLPRAYFKSPFDFTTDEWNASQGWSAGAVVSTPDDFAVFLKAFFNGELFAQETTLEQIKQHTSAGVDHPSPGAIYAHGMMDNSGVLGHGGQTLGFLSDGGYLPDKDVTIVIWSNAAESNVSRAIVPGIANAIVEAQ